MRLEGKTALITGAARGIGFSHLIGTGNEADLTAGEIAGMLVDEPEVDAVLLFLEAIRGAQHFAEAARRAHAAGKPVVAYKLGRSPYGAELAASHTGALAGTDAAADAFFRRLGIARVSTIEGLLELPALLAGREPLPRPRRGCLIVCFFEEARAQIAFGAVCGSFGAWRGVRGGDGGRENESAALQIVPL